jgi:predicted HAD superfamily Cof-like phosphohydrolase
MKNTIKEGDILVCKSNYVVSYKVHFEKNKKYKAFLYGFDSIYILSEFNVSFPLNDSLLSYFELKNPKEEKTDSIVEDVINQFRKRSQVGIEKYGTTLAENNQDDFLEHTKQELMDAVNYIQKLQTQRKDNIIQKVKEFNKAFNIPYSIVPNLSKSDKLLRFKLMQEENTEYLEAETIEDVADALGDQLYVLIGTILKHGLQDVIFNVFNEIHESNMSKLENGKALHREDGKILKGKDYFKPNLKQFFNK